MRMENREVKGEIAGGNAIGRKLGYPTANIYGVEGLDAPDGVYAVKANVAGVGNGLEGMANLGFRPTVERDGRQRVLEFHLFGFKGDLYGKEATLVLHQFIRPEMVFDSTDLLRRQIAEDEKTVRKYFSQEEK